MPGYQKLEVSYGKTLNNVNTIEKVVISKYTQDDIEVHKGRSKSDSKRTGKAAWSRLYLS